MKLFEERHNKLKEISKQFLTNKLLDKKEKFELSQEKYLLNKKQEDELREEKMFKKFVGYVRLFLIFICIYIYSIL